METNKIKPIKLGFFKKFGYSRGKISKYKDMREEGVLRAIKYFFDLLFIICILLAVIFSGIQRAKFNEMIYHLNDILPDVILKDSKLTLKENEEVIIDDEQVKQNLSSIIVINPNIQKEEAIKKYNEKTTEQLNCMVFLGEEYVIIYDIYNPESDSDAGVITQKYSETISKYLTDTEREYNQKDVTAYLQQRYSQSYYFGSYFIVYFINLLFIYAIYILLISFFLWAMSKFFNWIKNKRFWTKVYFVNWNYKTTFMNTIYGSTLSMVIYAIFILLAQIAGITVASFDIISMLPIFIYILILINKERKESQNDKETSKVD